MAIGAKNIFRHQHRLVRFIEQSFRSCSNQWLKTAAAAAAAQQQQQKLQQQQQQQQHEQSSNKLDSGDYQLAAAAAALSCQYASIPEPIHHDPNIGQQLTATQLAVRLAAPQQLQLKPDNDEDLVFGMLFTDHMLKVYYHRSLGGWQKPEITPLENLVMHPAAKVLHYALEIFEGMKAYRGVDGRIRLFRPEMNMSRMNLSAKRLGLPTFDGEEFIKCMLRLISIDSEWVPHQADASLYIRPTLIGIDPTLGVASSDSALLYTILSPVGSYFKADTSGAVSLLADPTYVRAWPGGVGNRKIGSNYAPTIQIQKVAAAKGLQQVLWLYGDDHQITEVGTMNIFMFYINDDGDKELRTPPLNGIILPGITRDSILSLARQWGKFKVVEGSFTMPMACELLNEGRLLEIFGTGTACVVSPVCRIHYLGQDFYIPTVEQEKPVYAMFRETLLNIQYGRVPHPWAVTID